MRRKAPFTDEEGDRRETARRNEWNEKWKRRVSRGIEGARMECRK
jgi:hypothetical protein